MSNLIIHSDPLVRTYVFYGGVLCLKMLLMSLLTGRQRFRKRVFCSPEDTKAVTGSKVQHDDEDVERVRRAHLNDLENILPFLICSWFYLLTNPEPKIAVNLFRVFTASRILHTLVYAVVVVPQPARFISWGIGYAITFYMALETAISFFDDY